MMNTNSIKKRIWNVKNIITELCRNLLLYVWTSAVDDNKVLDFNNLTSYETKQLNSIAQSLKTSFTSFIDEVTKNNSEDRFVWAIPMVSRSICNDDLFLNISRLNLARELVDEGKIEVVICDSKALYNCVRKNISKHIKVRYFAGGRCSRFWNWIGQKRYFNFLRELSQSGSVDFDFSETMSMIITPCLASQFDDLYYKDRYFGDLADYSINNVIYYPMVINNTNDNAEQLVTNLNKCKNTEFFCWYSYLNNCDYKDILAYQRMCRRMMRNRYCFEKLDITSIVCASLIKGLNDKGAFEGIFFNNVLSRIKEYGAKFDRFIVWYEARPSDVMVVASIRDIYPSAECIAYEGYPIDEMYIGLFTSQYQYESGHAPTKIAIPSEVYRESVCQFCDDVELLKIPIARNNYVLREARNGHVNSDKNILIVLPYFEDISRLILQEITSIVNRNENRYNIFIKNHPIRENSKMEDYGICEALFQPKYVRGRLDECLDEMDLVVTSLTTSTLEILFHGVPLVILSPKGQIKYTSLPDKFVEGMFKLVYDENELQSAIDFFLKSEYVMDNSSLGNLLVRKNYENMRKIWE